MVSSLNKEGERFEILKTKCAPLSSSSHGSGYFLTSCCVMWYQSLGYAPMAAPATKEGDPSTKIVGCLPTKIGSSIGYDVKLDTTS